MKLKLHVVALTAGVALFSLTNSSFAGKAPQAQLQAEAKVAKADAEKTALAKVPNGTVKESELEREHGKLIWSFDITTPKSKDITEVQVDAKNGKVVDVHVENAKDEAREAAEEKKEK